MPGVEMLIMGGWLFMNLWHGGGVIVDKQGEKHLRRCYEIPIDINHTDGGVLSEHGRGS